MVGNGMALVGAGPGQMCAPDVGQGGLQGAKEMWNAAGTAGLGCALRHGPPPPPQTQAGMGSRCVSWEGEAGRGELSAGRAAFGSHPHLHFSPACDRARPRPPALHLVHAGASEVPVALRHHETERSLEPRWDLQASPGLFPEYSAPCPDV